MHLDLDLRSYALIFICIHSLIIIRLIFTIFMHLHLHIHSLKCLSINYAVFICRLCLHVCVHRPRRLSMKCPRDKMEGDEVSPRQNGWRRSVLVTKRLAMKCTRDEMGGDKMYPRRHGRWQNGSDEMAATKAGVPVYMTPIAHKRLATLASNMPWLQTILAQEPFLTMSHRSSRDTPWNFLQLANGCFPFLHAMHASSYSTVVV